MATICLIPIILQKKRHLNKSMDKILETDIKCIIEILFSNKANIFNNK